MYRSLNTHSRLSADQSTLEKYLGVSHLSGISGSILSFHGLKLSSQVICRPLCVTVSRKVYEM